MNAFECPFSAHAKKNPSSIALIQSKKSWTYKECHKLIASLSAELKAHGVKPGDRIGLYPTNAFPTPLLFFALFRLQAIACPINTYLPVNEISSALDSSSVTYFLHPHSFTPPPLKQISLSFESLLKTHRSTPIAYFLPKNDQATYLFTSGTLSKPKIACHTIGNHYYSALGSNAYFPLTPEDRYLLSLPLYHVAGIALLFRSFLAGSTVVIPSEKPHLAKTLLETQTTHVSFIPTQLVRLLQTATPKDFSMLHYQLKGILLGGASISPALYKKSWEKGLPVYPSYGMTEMSSQICTQFEKAFASFSLGTPLPYREIKIASDHEILVRGKTLFQGYLNEQNICDPSLDQNGWFATGDVGTYSPKKGLLVNGRKDRQFTSGGENIQPEEIENHLRQLEGMIDVRIEPSPDQEFGMRPIAYIAAEKSYHDSELTAFLQDRLPKFKIPIAFLPLSSSPSQFKSHLTY